MGGGVAEVDQRRVFVVWRTVRQGGGLAGLTPSQGQLHVRLRVTSFHFVLPFLQHCSLEVSEGCSQYRGVMIGV